MFSAASISSSRQLLKSAAVVPARRSHKPVLRRNMGGGGGSSHPPMPQSMKAKLFEGHPEREGWEETVYFYYTVGFLWICYNANCLPETSVNTWARNEAAARLILKEEHGFTNFEFGKHYQDEVYVHSRKLGWEELNSKFNPFKDDDDEDEEGEGEADKEGDAAEEEDDDEDDE
ncbi:hypothetical protein ACA910_008906 [Epithemia clementina (nom. ined.)]